jgi:hypothetical protein
MVAASGVIKTGAGLTGACAGVGAAETGAAATGAGAGAGAGAATGVETTGAAKVDGAGVKTCDVAFGIGGVPALGAGAEVALPGL